jgi:arylsulfate sulfotransferase
VVDKKKKRARSVRGCRWIVALAFTAAIVLLNSCGGGSSLPPDTIAPASDIAQFGSQQGVTPFINVVQFSGSGLANLASVHWVISPKTGSVSRPVDATYTLAALKARGYVNAESAALSLPVFGLYAGFKNHLSIDFHLTDASTQHLEFDITTDKFVDPNGIYDRPTILKKRDLGSELGFDFFAMKSNLGTPVVVDSDGELRWVGNGINSSFSSIFQDNGFIVASESSVTLSRLELDGTIRQSLLASSSYTNFHHNIDRGKFYLLGDMDENSNLENVVIEFDPSGNVIKEWNFSALLGAYMLSQGDNPSNFVRPGIDWFHLNAATYDPRDDSLIVSSRENFVIKVDYGTGRIIWILGDPTKYWYTFPSLRAKALVLQDGDLYPIGQHSTSITSDGLLMLFNDGLGSVNQPSGAAAGNSRSYSAVSAYAIDPATQTAQEVWRFDDNQSIFSEVCSSAYESAGKSILVDYAVADKGTHARLVGLNASHQVVFDFQYPNTQACDTSWNAIPIPFDQLHFE